MIDGQNRVRVIVILTLPHSGSHLLSQLLGAHSQCVSIGEIHNYDKFTNRIKDGERNVIDNYAGDAIFRDLDSLPVDRWHQQIHANLQQTPRGISTLIDNSKRVAWCRKLMENPNLEVIPVHLVRDPRALIRYWMLRYNNKRQLRRQRIRHSRMAPLQAPALFTCEPLELYIRKWLIRNEQISRLLRQAGKSRNLVTYHDLAVSPAEALQRLMPLLALDYEAEQLNYGAAEQHGTLKREYESAGSDSRIDLDIRWQSYLSESDVGTVSQDSRLARYLKRLGLELTGSGLSAFH